MGVTAGEGARVGANRRSESRAIDATTRTGCCCLTAEPRAAISLPLVPSGTVAR